MEKYDVVNKPGSTKRTAAPPEQDRATIMGNTHAHFAKFGLAVPKIWSRTESYIQFVI